MRFSYKSLSPSLTLCIAIALFLFAYSIARAGTNIVLLGAPGSGKRTVAALLSEKLKVPHLSSEEVILSEIDSESAFGKRAKDFFEKGQLLPDQPEYMGMFFESLRKRLSENDSRKGVILDGVPRTAWQASELERTLTSLSKKLDYVFLLDVNREALLSRMVGRQICKPCRLSFHSLLRPPRIQGTCDQCGRRLIQREDDDQSKIVHQRLEAYSKQIEPVIEYFEKKGKLVRVQGAETPDEVSEQIWTILQCPEAKTTCARNP